MVALSLIELFVVIFSLIFIIILLYVVCRKFCSSLSTATGQKIIVRERTVSRTSTNTDTSTNNDTIVNVSGSGSPQSGTRNPPARTTRHTRNSIPSANRRPNIPAIYLGTRNELLVGNSNSHTLSGAGSRSIYTIPVRTGTGEIRRASVIVLHNLRNPSSAQNLRIIQIQQQQQPQVPQAILEELPPSYDECIEIDDESDPKYLPPPPYTPFPSYNVV